MLSASHLRTTAYYPCSNGLVQRFRRSLKASLRTYTPAATWTKALSLVMLGLRRTYKIDLTYTTAKMVSGTTLCFPGDYFCTSDTALDLDSVDYFTQLRNLIQCIYSCRTWHSLLAKLLLQCSLVQQSLMFLFAMMV